MELLSSEPITRETPGNLRIIFLHHSTGRNLIAQGRVRALFRQRNARDGTSYEFWDHDYNEIGLSGPSGEKTGISFAIPDDNTDPDGLAKLFGQSVHNPPDNALSNLLSYDVIIFKSCFPVSAIGSQARLEEYKQHYISIRETLARYPEKLFIVVTPPPLVPRSPIQLVLGRSQPSTNSTEARRAREFSQWLTSDEFLAGMPNVTTFDLFGALARPGNSRHQPNTLRVQFRSGRFGLDSHPNLEANLTIAPLFVGAILSHITATQQALLSSTSSYIRSR